MAEVEGVFEYRDYRKFLLEVVAKRPRGEKTQLSKAMNCHPTYLSQVLKGSVDLSLEQAKLASEYLGHTTEEAQFFLLLVLQARAGTVSLRQHFAEQLEQILKRRLVLKNRLAFDRTLTKEDQMTYYSAWYYAAIHMLVSVPGLQTREAISRRLGLSNEKVAEVLDFLVSRGLAQEIKGTYQTGEGSIHLGSDSPMVSKHHTNWRMQAIASLDREAPDDLHYSSVVTMARADMPRAKNIMIKAIEEIRALVRESKEETLCSYMMDFIEVRR